MIEIAFYHHGHIVATRHWPHVPRIGETISGLTVNKPENLDHFRVIDVIWHQAASEPMVWITLEAGRRKTS